MIIAKMYLPDEEKLLSRMKEVIVPILRDEKRNFHLGASLIRRAAIVLDECSDYEMLGSYIVVKYDENPNEVPLWNTLYEAMLKKGGRDKELCRAVCDHTIGFVVSEAKRQQEYLANPVIERHYNLKKFSKEVQDGLALLTQEGIIWHLEHDNDRRDPYDFWLQVFDPNSHFFIERLKHAKAIEDDKYKARDVIYWMYNSPGDMFVRINGKTYFGPDILHGGEGMMEKRADRADGVLHWFMANNSNKVLSDYATNTWGAPKKIGDALALQIFRAPYQGYNHKKYGYDNNYDAPKELGKETKVYHISALEKGLVIELFGRKYEVFWKDVVNKQNAPWDRPDLAPPFLITETDKPVTREYTKKGKNTFTLWGDAYYQQDPPRVLLNGKEAIQFICIHDWHGHDFTVNLLLGLDEDNKPSRIWLNGSCT